MNTTATQSNTDTQTPERPWRGVFFRGPLAVKTYDEKQAANWRVYQGDNQGRPRGTVYELSDFSRAGKLAEKMARDRGIELIKEASELQAA